jgi:hypothetical protein
MRDLRTLSETHRVCPLPVYKDNAYEPLHAHAYVKTAMMNTLVEVHFSVRHYHIKTRSLRTRNKS